MERHFEIISRDKKIFQIAVVEANVIYFMKLLNMSPKLYGFFNSNYYWTSGPGSSVGIATELRAGPSGDPIPVGGEISRTCPDRPWSPPSLLYNGYRVFPGYKERPERDTDPSPPFRAVVMKE